MQEVIEALTESNIELQDEVKHLRENSKMLRAIISTLRATNESLRSQIAIAEENDETFRKFCAGDFDFDAKVTEPEDSGLLESGSQVDGRG